MNLRPYIVLVYGLCLLAGGTIGYLRANSIMSLVMGASFAILVIISALAMRAQHPLGSRCALLLSGILTLFFGYRFMISQSFMPSGLMSLLSVLVILSLLWPQKNNAQAAGKDH